MLRMIVCTLALGLTAAAASWATEPGPIRTGLPVRAAATTAAGNGQKAALNPQPLPPRWRSPYSPAGKVMLNPQPLPPRTSEGRFDKVLLNPQPLPPRVIHTPFGKRVIRPSPAK